MSVNTTIIPATSVLHLRVASKYLSLTFALPLCVCGVLGNLLNILVFFCLGNYKRNASSLYVLCKSFFDLTVLILGLGLRVLSHGFRIDFSLKSRLWCKTRVTLLEIGILNSWTCLCLQSIDIFFCSSTSINRRQKSNVRTARYILILFTILWIAHQIPYVILQDLIIVKGTPTCRTTNPAFVWYRNYFLVFVFTNIIPISIISIFGFLTYRHLHALEDINSCTQPRQRSRSLSHLTRQMTNMTLSQIIIVSLCQTPFVIAQLYSCATESMIKNAFHQAQEQLAQMIVVTCSYGTYASSFYCYCAVSKRFRTQVLDALKQCRVGRRNRPLPFEVISHMVTRRLTTQT